MTEIEVILLMYWICNDQTDVELRCARSSQICTDFAFESYLNRHITRDLY
jgi:hypothetical protein